MLYRNKGTFVENLRKERTCTGSFTEIGDANRMVLRGIASVRNNSNRRGTFRTRLVFLLLFFRGPLVKLGKQQK